MIHCRKLKKVRHLGLCVCVCVASELAHFGSVNNAAVVCGAASKYLSTHASSDHQVRMAKFELYS